MEAALLRAAEWLRALAADPAAALQDRPAALALVALALVALGWALLRRRRRRARQQAAEEGLGRLAAELEALAAGQERLTGALRQLAEGQAASQARLAERFENRLEQIQRRVDETLHGAAQRTARSLGELGQRLETIDRAQARIEKLSGEVLSLQDILSNKQSRGLFGEIQLHDIVTRALPPDAYAFQVTLSNGRRADCLIRLPDPPGPIVIDAKFPLEPWERLRAAGNDRRAGAEAARAFRDAVRAHIRAIAERYIIEGETAEGALMFLPSEAVYADLHARFGEVVREGFEKRVWIVSPTTCMATLNTLRGVMRDARMRQEAGRIRRELGLLARDVGRLGERVANLDRHFALAARDLDEIRISAGKVRGRAERLESFEFDRLSAPAEGERPAAPARAGAPRS